MDTQTFTVANVKCGGCVANIKKGLAALDGVASVEADAASGEVVVRGGPGRAELAAKLAELGYPEID
ncbi:MAG TPA: cation transporter [Candidatus Tenderia sp.]|nr:cation transporter [Candidatus Tenderia sp.]